EVTVGKRTDPVRAEEAAHRWSAEGRASALGVLGRLAGLLQTRLLTLDDAGVAREEAGLLERGAVVLGVDLVERTSDAEAQRTGLARAAAAGDAGDDVEPALDLDHREGRAHELLVDLVREVLLERAAVDLPLADRKSTRLDSSHVK